MKLFYTLNLNLSSFLASAILLLVMVSCGSSYKSVYNDTDGIYSSGTPTEEVVVVARTHVPSEEELYFAQVAEDYSTIQDEDLTTSADDLYYDEVDSEGNTIIYQNNYYDTQSSSAPWGYSSDVSVNFNVGAGFGYGYYGNTYYGNTYYGNPYYGGYYGNPYYGGYYPPYYGGYYPPYYGGGGYYPPYYRNRYDSYGKRGSYSTGGSYGNRRSVVGRNSGYTANNRTSSRRGSATGVSRVGPGSDMSRSGTIKNSGRRTNYSGSKTNNRVAN
ncbi:MAG: hypothetical protein KAH07_05160, partial [Flavobacteriaceae bacterium]|nr:hypothetical protein [Flavobacteriaceae bacterium]